MDRVRLAPLAMLLSLVLAPTTSSGSIGMSDGELANRVDRTAGEAASRGDFSGVVLIARNGRTLLEKAYGPADRSAGRPNRVGTRFNVASLGKMFTGVAVASLVESGRLRYDATVGAYLADFPNAEIRDRVTIHQLLTHTSGIPDLPDALFTSPPSSLQGYLPFFASAKLQFEPGAQRAYSNAGFVLLGLIVERASGMRYREFVERVVFRPAGMRAVAWSRGDTRADTAIGYTRSDSADEWTPNTSTIAPQGGPHGGAHVTAADLARFFHALRAGRLVGRRAAVELTTPQRGASSAYGFGVLDFDTDRLVGHSGGDVGASADAYVYWESGYTIVVLANLGPPASHKIAGAARELVEPRFTRRP